MKSIRHSNSWTPSLAFLTFLALFLIPMISAFADMGTFAGGGIAIGTTTSATPYPSSATVSGLSGIITNVTVQINGFNMGRQRDVDVLLVHADGSHNLIVQADAGSNTAVTSVSYTISDLGVTMPSTDASPMANGATYKPYDLTAGDAFPAPAPCTGNGTTTTCNDPAPAASATLAAAFNGLTANGTWKLYVVNDTNSVAGSIASWSVTITTQSTTAIVGDFVFNDLNGDGIQNAGEPGIDGVTVRLLNSPSLTTAGTTTTAGGGLYGFSSVPAGNYVMEFVAPSGFVFSPKDQGGNDTLDSDANTGTGRTDQFALAGGQTDTTRDCGMIGTYVGNFVFGDTNRNGIQDAGENGIDGVTVRLLNSSNGIVATTTTGGGGFYRFFVTPAGTYSVEFVLPAGFTFSPQDQGGNDTLDSDANTSTGRTTQFTVTNGAIDNTRDAGMYAATLGTFSLCNTSGIAIGSAAGAAAPYPSSISFGGVVGTVANVTVQINGFNISRQRDVDLLLVSPDGSHNLTIQSDAGSNTAPTPSVNYTISDSGATMPSTDGLPLVNGTTYKPFNMTPGDAFPAPAPCSGNCSEPAPAGSATLASTFNGLSANGPWNLYVVNDTGGVSGSIASWCLAITTTAPPLQLDSAVSRKPHGGVGTFNINLPLVGEPGVECRVGPVAGEYTLVFTFNNNVVSGSASMTTGVGNVSGSPTFAANTMTVNLTGVTDVQKITVTLTNVTDSFAQVLPSAAVSVNMLGGDTSGNKTVNGTDVSQTKLQSGSAASAANFRSDVNASGTVNGTDVSIVKLQSGSGLP